MSVNLAGPAYRVTVPACVLVATLRKKLKAEQAKQAEQEADEKKMWYLVIAFCILIGLAVLAVFSSKENTIQAMTQAIAQKAVLKNLKNLATKIKKWQQPLQNTKPPQAQKQQGSKRLKSIKESKIPF